MQEIVAAWYCAAQPSAPERVAEIVGHWSASFSHGTWKFQEYHGRDCAPRPEPVVMRPCPCVGCEPQYASSHPLGAGLRGMASSDIAWHEGTDRLDVASHLAAHLRQKPKPRCRACGKNRSLGSHVCDRPASRFGGPWASPHRQRPRAPPARRVIETSLPPAHRPLFCTHA